MIDSLHKTFLSSTGVSTDTRKIKAGELFFALSGPNFNGNTYVEQAFEKGAAHVVCTDPDWENHPFTTVVKDSLKTLQDLATFHRNYLNIPIVALTGSNGKTTTKELILSVLKTQYHVKGTEGNLNNHIGVPLTLLSFTKLTEIGVVEMGANHLDEIAALSAIAQPNYGLITNFGKAHLEGFGSEENIVKGKSELFDYLNTHNQTAIIGFWDDRQQQVCKATNKVITSKQVELTETSPFLQISYKNTDIATQLTGTYNYYNILLAIAVGEQFDIPLEKIKRGISDYLPSNNRSQIIHKPGLRIILDAYNANPSSMQAALKNLTEQPEEEKHLLLGDMFELGEYAQQEHQNICDLIDKSTITTAHLVGEHFFNCHTIRAKLHKTYDDFKNSQSTALNLQGVVLIKGSRGMALERSLELF